MACAFAARTGGPARSATYRSPRSRVSVRVEPVSPGTVPPVRNKDYGDDVLAGDWRRPSGRIPDVPAEHDLVVEEPSSGFCGAVVACEKDAVTLEDRFGGRRVFPLAKAGFLLDGRPVTLVRPARAAGTARSASGSIAVRGLRAQVAKESRIYVEGVHDAELIEKIWGHDLRVEGVVVEYLEGVDDLPAIVAEFAPGPAAGSACWSTTWSPAPRRAGSPPRSNRPMCWSPGIRSSTSGRRSAGRARHRGLARVPKGVPWKEGVLSALGWSADVGEDGRRSSAGTRLHRPGARPARPCRGAH